MLYYQIKIRGRLPADIHSRFRGFQVIEETRASTLLAGPVVDQSELHGVLSWLRDLNLDLLSVQYIGPVSEREEEERNV